MLGNIPRHKSLKKCGFCSKESDGNPDTPKMLPCNHVHCLSCLKVSYYILRVVMCPFLNCEKVFDITPERLPAHNAHNKRYVWCEICLDNGGSDFAGEVQPSLYRCEKCKKGLCNSHFQVHKHEQTKAEPIRPSEQCKKHKDKRYRAGCKICLKLVCMNCHPIEGKCTTGKDHDFLDLDELVKLVNKQIYEMKVKMSYKEGHLQKIFELSSMKLEEYNGNTGAMFQRIQNVKYGQSEVSRIDIDKIEERLIETRIDTKIRLMEFMEEVEEVCTTLKDLCREFDDRERNKYQCDIVNGYSKSRNAIREILVDELPRLEIDTEELSVKDNGKETIFEVIPAERVVIRCEHEPTILVRPPKSANMVYMTNLTNYVMAVFYHKENGYVVTGGSEPKILKIDENFKESTFLTFSKRVKGMTIYEDRMYCLVHETTDDLFVHVYDLFGELLTKWSHSDSKYFTQHAICNNKLILPDRKAEKLIVYSLHGTIMESIACPHIKDADTISLCTAGKDSVVLSVCSSNQVIKVNIASGDVEWSCNDVYTPNGIACYAKRYILVAERQSCKVKVLDVKQGVVVSEIFHPAMFAERSNVFSLHVCYRTLLFGDMEEQTVVFFELDD